LEYLVSASKDWGCYSLGLFSWKTLGLTGPHSLLFHSYPNRQVTFDNLEQTSREKNTTGTIPSLT